MDSIDGQCFGYERYEHWGRFIKEFPNTND